MTHICVSKPTIIGSHNRLSPSQPQVIIWTNTWILLIWTLGINFNEILSEISTFSFENMHLKMVSAKWQQFLSQPQCVKLTSLALGYSYDNFKAVKEPWQKFVNGSYETTKIVIWPPSKLKNNHNAESHKLLHSPSLVAIGLSVGYETWPPIGWHHAFVIG